MIAGTADDPIYQMFQAVLWKSLGDLRDATVLDVGCGPGWLCKHIKDAGGDVLGIDGSSAFIATARTIYPDIPFASLISSMVSRHSIATLTASLRIWS